MIIRCTEPFETRERGFGKTIEEGTVWYTNRHVILHNYECVDLIRIENGDYTSDYATVRASRMRTNFESVPSSRISGLERPVVGHE